MVRGDFLTPPKDLADDFVMPNKSPALLSTTIEFINRCILIRGRVHVVWSVWGVYRRDVTCLLSGQCVVYTDVRSGACMWSGQCEVCVDVTSGARGLVRVGYVST